MEQGMGNEAVSSAKWGHPCRFDNWRNYLLLAPDVSISLLLLGGLVVPVDLGE